MSLLSRVHEPADLRRLSQDQLVALADEIREFLISHIAETGGHLSPNLGVVELTLALHRVFESPRDAIVWDTGHQAYVHKLITGRAEGFKRLRQRGGMSGYPSRSESDHDLVENSHASTSLSYALGISQARLRRRERGHVVAVIGDGALTGGMAYEALNQIAHLQPPNLTIVINDNGRSYAPTVGGLAKHLANLVVDPRYERIKDEISERLRELPAVGGAANQAVYRLKEGLKQLVAPTTFFEALDLKYAGPVDGHDIAALEKVLRGARAIGEPVVIQAVTEKGHGYAPAIDDEVEKLHGVSAFDPETGRAHKSELTYTDVFSDAILAAATRRPELVAITAAMASPTGLLDFSREFPERFFDVGICEQHAVTFAAGLAMAGLRPVVAIYSTFLQRAFDQVVHDVAMHRLPVVFVIDRAGVTGPDGASHHGMLDLAYLRTVPNLAIAAPADEGELGALLEAALEMDGPIAIRYPKAVARRLPEHPAPPLPVSRWEVVRRGGGEIAIVAIGRMVGAALEAAALLARDGVEATVVNARWLKPLDGELLEDVARRHRLVLTVEDGIAGGGLGTAVLEALAPAGLSGKVRVHGLPDQFLAHGRPAEILTEHGLTGEGIAARVRVERGIATAGKPQLTA